MKTFLITAVLFFLLISCKRPADSVPGIYQGILRSASGPGIERTLYLKPNGDYVSRMIYFKSPEDTFIDFGTWQQKSSKIILTEVNGSEDSNEEFHFEKNSLSYSGDFYQDDQLLGFKLLKTASY